MNSKKQGQRMRLLPVLLAGAVSGAAMATEGGGSVRAFGIDTIFSGVMPAPGSTTLNAFLTYYDSERNNDSAGNPRPGISDFKLHGTSLAFRLGHVWDQVDWLGANVESRVAISLLDSDVRFNVQTPGGPLPRQGSATGLSDLLLAPVMLGWHSQTYHQTAAIFLYLPVGEYDSARIANTGRGYFAWAPTYLFTWLPMPGAEVSGNATYIFNSTNGDTNYRSGNEFALDYGLSYSHVPPWRFGISGYLYKQITDDKIDGRVVGDGNKGEVIAIGPFIGYRPSQDWGVVLKWQYEAQTENRPQGNRFILQVIYKLP